MAFAEYFHKNEQAGALLLKGFSTEALRHVLSTEVIGVFFDGSATASAEGRASIDLLTRLLARFYPTLAFIPLDERASEYAGIPAALAAEINPNIELCVDQRKITRALICGQTRLRLRAPQLRTKIYVGSERWVAKISATTAVGGEPRQKPRGHARGR
jgi:hypothetical protein